MTLSHCCVHLSLTLVNVSLLLGLMHFPTRPLQRVQAMMSFIKPFIASPSKKPTSLDVLVATAGDLQRGLSSGQLTSVGLVDAYLDQIENHDDYLHAIISKPPRVRLVEQARKLDEERESKAVRGRLHGIPILIKVGLQTFLSAYSLILFYRTISRHCQSCTWARLQAVSLLLVPNPRAMLRSLIV